MKIIKSCLECKTCTLNSKIPRTQPKLLDVTKIFRFGVCCVFMTSTCGASISVNCSYIKNPGFPSAFTSTSGCSYTINKCDSCKNLKTYIIYLTRAIVIRGLYTFYPIFEGQKCFFKSFFRKIRPLCKVSIQERFIIESGL